MSARLYRPKASPSSGNPLLVYFHFGGCVLGSLDSCHTVCSLIAERSGSLVLSASYRLAPEHRFPAALDDALAAFRWAKDSARYLGADPDLISIGGDSAGGYLAAAVSLRLRDAQESLPCLQLLIYPVLEMNRRAMPATPFDHCYPLTRDDMIWYCDQYMRDERDAEDPMCSVARASTLAGLPPTILVQAGYDLLFAEGEAFGRRLEEDGVSVSRLVFPSLPHAFTAMSGGVAEARDAIMTIADAVKASVAHAREQEHQLPARSEA
ncbi:MAG: alpha/beta hydrolase [Proteobacteria bacterium]|nr:alpha/beta hydrolase [Pseudomonadota bacterium]